MTKNFIYFKDIDFSDLSPAYLAYVASKCLKILKIKNIGVYNKVMEQASVDYFFQDDNPAKKAQNTDDLAPNSPTHPPDSCLIEKI